MKIARILAASAAFCLCAVAEGQAAETVELTTGHPHHQLFIPSRHGAGPAPLVVMLHGCNQDAVSVAAGTNWNRVAEEQGFFVLYVNQARGRNALNCWNWFLPDNQQAGSGEPAAIMAAVDEVIARYPVDPHKVSVAGMSAGGAMAAIMLSCYPERFAAGAIYSGLPYGIVNGMWDAFTVMTRGAGERPRRSETCDPHAFHGNVIVVQGDHDRVVNPENADRLLADFLPTSATERRTTAVPGDGHALGYQLTTVSQAGRVIAERVLVDGSDHVWMGGADGVPYCDPRGPNMTAMIWGFFAAAQPNALTKLAAR